MPLPIILGAAAAGAGLFGAKKGHDAYQGSKKAKSLNKRAERTYDRAAASLDQTRENTKNALETLGRQKLTAWDEDIGKFVELFEQLKRVELTGAAHLDDFQLEITEETLAVMAKTSYEAKDICAGVAGSVGGGTLTALAAYGTAMKVGTASTGAAIGSLSGAAATNATLAWFGGGSLASGGLGIAGGTVVLGGLVAGPALAIGGMIASSQVRKKVANAKKNVSKARRAAAKMRTAKSGLKGIVRVANLVDETLEKARERFRDRLTDLEMLIEENGTDYREFGKQDRQLVHETVMWAQLVKELLEIPLLKDDGSLSGKHQQPIQQAKTALSEG